MRGKQRKKTRHISSTPCQCSLLFLLVGTLLFPLLILLHHNLSSMLSPSTPLFRTSSITLRHKTLSPKSLSDSLHDIFLCCFLLMQESGGPSQDGLQAQGTVSTTSAPVACQKPRVRARRGQATDPHSIAERVYLHYSLTSPSLMLSWVDLIVWLCAVEKRAYC